MLKPCIFFLKHTKFIYKHNITPEIRKYLLHKKVLEILTIKFFTQFLVSFFSQLMC